MKLRIAALLLTLLMLVSVFAACTDPKDDDKPAETTPSESTTPEETTEPAPEFLDKKFNTTFVVYTRPADASSYAGFYIVSDDVSDTMSEAVYTRNITVQEKYGITISTATASDPYKDLSKNVEAGEVPYDMLLDRRSKMKSVAQDGYLYNFNDLEHVDFSQPYWDSKCAEGYSVGDKLFFMANDVSVSNIAQARFFIFNHKLVSDYNLENPYDLVEKNQWTLDKTLSMIKGVSTENGDGVWDGNDVYGLLHEKGSSNGLHMHLLVGSGVSYIEKNNDGTLTTNAYSDKTQSVLEKIYEAVEGTNYACTYDAANKGADRGDLSTWDYARNKLFATDHFLFVHTSMNIIGQIKDMESDYGCVPNPKYDASQEEYYHKMDTYALIWAIPNAELDYEKIGAVMEYWSYVSNSTVMPAYYEKTLQNKTVRDPRDAQMLDLVKNNIKYDLNDIYSSGIAGAINDGYTSGTLASTWESTKQSVEESLAEIYTKISELQ